MNLKASIERMRADIRGAYKSEDTESWGDRAFTKPFGYFLARFFIHYGWTPNMVTMLSLLTGVLGGCLFASEHFALNLIGILLVIFARLSDSADGQMARLTGNRSMMGSALGVLSSVACTAAMYGGIAVRMHAHNIPFTHTQWGGIIWVIVILSALAGRVPQRMMSDYYRSFHLFILKRKDPAEWVTAAQILKKRSELPRNAFLRRLYMYLYALYTRIQEAVSPDTQRLCKAVCEAGLSEEVRSDYLDKSRRYIRVTNLLSYNVRTYTLFICLLFGVPVLAFAIELLGLGALLIIMVRSYEKAACSVLYDHKLPGSEEPHKKSNPWSAVFFVFGIIGVISTLASTDLSAVNWKGDVLDKLMIWLPSILGIWLLIYIIHTIVYAIIIGSDAKKIKPLKLFKMVISGFALNNVTPVGFAGGEPYRIMELKGNIGTEKATASAFTFTMMNTRSHFLFWFTGALMYIVTGCKGGVLPTIIAVIVLGVMGFVTWMFIKSKGNNFMVGTLTKLSKLPLLGKYCANLLNSKRDLLERIDTEMGLFHARKRDFIIVFTAEFTTRILEAAEMFVLLNVLGADISFFYAIASLATASLIGNLIFFIPMQMGSREAAFAVSLGWAGAASSVAITASLLSRIREIVYLALGVSMMLMKTEDPDKKQDT